MDELTLMRLWRLPREELYALSSDKFVAVLDWAEETGRISRADAWEMMTARLTYLSETLPPGQHRLSVKLLLAVVVGDDKEQKRLEALLDKMHTLNWEELPDKALTTSQPE